jgi:hypothetical protein
MFSKVTVVIHIYNEEYLLPFWLEHHRNMFDHGIIIDYRSTDNSINICRKMCPTWEIVTTRNANFGAHSVDAEVMDIETRIQGAKIALNVTEFIFCDKPLSNYFDDSVGLRSYAVTAVSPYCQDEEINPRNLDELLTNLFDDRVRYQKDRGSRYLHNYPHGNYIVGRHVSRNPTHDINTILIVWFGFFPMNKRLLQRKMQIRDQIPHGDRVAGLGFHHLFEADRVLEINREKSNSGISIRNIDDSTGVYKQIYNVLTQNSQVHYPELIADSTWGDDQVFLRDGTDVNLLAGTDFDDTGFCILEPDSINKHYSDFISSLLRDEIRKTVGYIIEDLVKYHDAVSEDDHRVILNSMPFKRESSPEIDAFCEYLEGVVSKRIGQRVKIFNNDLWFRICRPTVAHPDDFNPCHRDIYLDFYRNILNIYLPVAGSDERSSLLLQPGSHLWNENETRITSGGAHFKTTTGKKYSVDAIVASRRPLSMVRPNPSENQLMIFSPYLIHGCASNENPDMTRISVEARFIRDDDAGRQQEAAFNAFLSKRDWR